MLGFDLAWDPAYYEDTDLCLKISSQGLKIYYCPSSTVVHYESVTTSDTSQALRLDNLKEVNRQKFVARWGDRLRGNGAEGPPAPTYPNSCITTAREPLRRLAVYAPDKFYPGGSERYILAFADALKDTHRVWLITSERYSRIRVHTVARELGIELGRVNVASLDELAGMERFDIALVAGSEILPPVQPVGRRTFYYCHVPFNVPRSELARRWAWWNRYERCLVSSDRVRQTIFASLRELHLPEKPFDLIPPPFAPLNIEDSSFRFKENIILHVGRFRAGKLSKHQDKLISVFGTLLESGITGQLHLAGVVQPDINGRNFYLYCQKMAQNLPVYFHPNVPRRRLEALYRRSACFWAWAGDSQHRTTPEMIAASARISIREAQSAGCICFIVDEKACLDNVRNGLDGFVITDAEDLVRLTHRALIEKDAPWATDMRSRAVERARLIFPSFQQRCRELASSGAEQEHENTHAG